MVFVEVDVEADEQEGHVEVVGSDDVLLGEAVGGDCLEEVAELGEAWPTRRLMMMSRLYSKLYFWLEPSLFSKK